MSRSDNERRQIEERLADLNSTVGELKRQKDQLSEFKSKAQQDLEMENGDIKERLRTADQRATLLDDSKSRLEAELNSTKKSLSEKHMEVERMLNEKDGFGRTVRALEDQNDALKNKVEELKTRLAAISSSEADLKDKLAQLNRSFKEACSSTTTLQEELSRV